MFKDKDDLNRKLEPVYRCLLSRLILSAFEIKIRTEYSVYYLDKVLEYGVLYNLISKKMIRNIEKYYIAKYQYANAITVTKQFNNNIS